MTRDANERIGPSRLFGMENSPGMNGRENQGKLMRSLLSHQDWVDNFQTPDGSDEDFHYVKGTLDDPMRGTPLSFQAREDQREQSIRKTYGLGKGREMETVSVVGAALTRVPEMAREAELPEDNATGPLVIHSFRLSDDPTPFRYEDMVPQQRVRISVTDLEDKPRSFLDHDAEAAEAVVLLADGSEHRRLKR